MKTKTILLIGAAIALAGGAFAWREYNRTAQDASTMAAGLVNTHTHDFFTQRRASLGEAAYANGTIPPAALSEALPYSEDIDRQAEWMAEQLYNN